MVERPELAASLIDAEPFPPSSESQEGVWAGLERDLRSLSDELRVPLAL